MFLFTFWPNHENDFSQPPNLSSHILYTYTHIRLQNKIIHSPVKYKIKEIYSRKKRRFDLRNYEVYSGYAWLGDYRNIVIYRRRR